MERPELNLAESSLRTGFDLRVNGQLVTIEDALKNGFVVPKEDSHVVLTLLSRWLAEKDQHQM